MWLKVVAINRIKICNADGEAVLVHLGVRVDCVQADQLPGDAFRHLLRAQPHRPQRREVILNFYTEKL